MYTCIYVFYIYKFNSYVEYINYPDGHYGSQIQELKELEFQAEVLEETISVTQNHIR